MGVLAKKLGTYWTNVVVFRYTWEGWKPSSKDPEILTTISEVCGNSVSNRSRKPPVDQVLTAKTVWIGSRPIQTPNLLLLVMPNPDPYPSTHGFCCVWLDPSVPMSCSGYQVFLFMVAFRYGTANRKILTLVCHCLF